ncbi:DivIVA domain-containing protein [Xylanimonas allomyrinae]|uniref:DivIVA domain-containing protein n=1 Tax=Xylanimonas allomyrinae TaxID=2509459 RepID=A0A4P6EIY6_9MICO|nr:DivIVA domain-containing protein [Xylanimonas allomyrinae]QAY62265.1 DivIVA domain-containing protein [Xylanimonas allomyrinae]
MSSALFGTVSVLRTGYDKDEVDEFFDHARQAYEGRSSERLDAGDIQTTTFDLVRGGYDTHEVDAALDRLEAAFVARQRAEFVASQGQDAWMATLAERARTLYGRLGRPEGEKFAPAERGQQGYDKDDVDALCDRLVGYFDRQEPLTSAELRAATFASARGANGYAEGPVDAFFARAVEVLLGVE